MADNSPTNNQGQPSHSESGNSTNENPVSSLDQRESFPESTESVPVTVEALEGSSASMSVMELQQEIQRLKFSRDMTREFVRSTGSMKKVMEVIFNRVVEILEAEAGSLWLLDHHSGLNICHLAEGPAKSRILGLRLPRNEGIVGQVITTNRSEVVLDCTRDKRFAAGVDQRSGFKTQSMLCVPLAFGSNAFGAIQIINKKSGIKKQFTTEDQRMVEDLALSAAIAVRNARVLDSVNQVQQRTKFSRDMTREFVRSTGSMKKVMETIFNRVVEILEAEAGSLWILDAGSGQNICHLAEGPAKTRILGLRLPKEQGIVGEVITTGKHQVVLDCSKDPRFAATVDAHSGFKTQSMLCVPLVDGDHAFGAIQIINKKSGLDKQFTEEDQRIVDDLALSAAIAVRNARLMDSVNQVQNRLKFSRDMAREFVRSTGSMKKVMEVVFTRVVEILEAEAGSMWMLDVSSGQNICHLAEGPAKTRIMGLRLPKDKGIVGQVIGTNKPEVVLDCSRDPRFAASVDEQSGFKTRSMLCVPLADGEQAFGAIQIINKKSGVDKRFTEEDQHLVDDLAQSASIAVRNARLLETESRVREMKTLMEVSRQISSTLNLDQVLGMVVNMANELVPITGAAVALLSEKKDELFLSMLSGGRKVDMSLPEHKNLLSLMESVRKSERLSYIPNVAAYRQQTGTAANPWADYMEASHLAAIWSAPLKDEEGPLGVMWMESQTADFAGGNKSDMLMILATQATVALRNASLFQRIPFADVLGKMGGKGKTWLAGWRRTVLIGMALVGIAFSLHYLPVFRWVTGPCVVEARFGRGVYLPVAGRVEKSLVHEANQVRKGDLLLTLDATPIRLRLVEAESKLGILERQIVEAKAASDMAAMSRAVVERIAAQAELARAQEEMALVSIHAPMDGIVLTPRPEELVGRDFPLGAEVLRLADPSQFTIMVELPEEDVLDVQPGQKVRGVLRSRPGKGFTGDVVHVGRAYAIPVEALEKGVVDTKAPQGFVAEVHIDHSDVQLRPGMTGQAIITTPETSALVRIKRRLVNTLSFWFGY
ncbi:MAG: GAF domain-containing protein [Magnetococcus sp. DMHC-1]|nr:GAF domain-containing protein [Magnetococcales bacterium]